MSNAVKRSQWNRRVNGTLEAPDLQKTTHNFAFGRIFVIIGTVLTPVILLLAIAIGLLYVRLLNGPISLEFLKEPIERNISAELPGFKISVGQTVVALREQSFEFRLTNVQLTDQTGKPVAIAASAAVEVSLQALLSGIISPSHIVLIEPRLLVFYTPNDGLSLTIDTVRGGPSAPLTHAEGPPRLVKARKQITPSQMPVAGTSAELAGRINLAQTIASLTLRAREKGNATSYLDRIGLRNATVIIDNDGTRTALRVSKADFNLARSHVRSVLSGNIAIASKQGTWRVGLRVEDAQDRNQVRLTTVLKDVYPQAIADTIPKFKALNQLRFPISAKADYVLSSQGQVLGGIFDIALGSGKVEIPSLGVNSPSLTSGRARIIYRRGENHIKVDTATLRWADSSLTLTGLVKQRIIGSGIAAWDFQLQAKDGHLATRGDRSFVKIKRWDATGTLLPKQGIVNLDQALIETDGGSLVMDGVVYTGRSPGFSMNGRFSPMSAQNLLAYWPKYVAVDARKWAAKNILAGQLLGGTFAMRLRAPSEAVAGAKVDYKTLIKAEIADARFNVNEKLPNIHASRAQINFEDEKFMLRIPQSGFVLGNKRSMLISDLNFEIKNVFAPDVDGHAKLKISGNVGESLDIIRQLDIGDTKALADLRQRFSGKINGDIKIVLPLGRPSTILPEPQIFAQIRVMDGHAKDVWKSLDIKGSNVILDITERNMVVRGDVLLKGVPIKIGWRKNLKDNRQTSPLTIQATLDDADRNSLGLAINHLLKGPIEVSAVINALPDQGASNKAPAHVRIDLTNAALEIKSIAWKKTIGRKAFLDFDVVARSTGGWRVSNLRIDGDKIAAQGDAHINTKGELVAFHISDFAIDVVTRLKIKGELRTGNVWRVSVAATAFEGRNFFRTLFSTQNTSEPVNGGTEPGLDLDVRIKNILGYWDTTLKDLRVDLSKRNGKMIALSASGKFKSGGHLRAVVQRKNKIRQLVATSNDAGKAFKLVGFYPNVRSGQLKAIIDLESTQSGVRSGLLNVRRFDVLGDQIVSEVLNNRRRRQRNANIKREVLQFDWMQVPFVVGGGRFVMRDAQLRGPILGVVLCGKADFENRQMQVAGTYIPLQGLSAVVGSIPGIGNLLAGPKGEGIIGINFEVRGAMGRPEVLINPLSAVTPGIFREVFKVACPDSKFVLNKKRSKGLRSKKPKIDKGWTSEMFKSTR